MKRLSAVVLSIAIVIALGACGDDDNDATSEAAVDEVACERVGDGGGTPVAVALGEWAVSAQPTSVRPGKITFDATNSGAAPHELVVVRGQRADLVITAGQVDEDALADGAFIGEIEPFPAGDKCDGTFELAAGPYVLFCNILEDENGERESHVENGMVTTFTVA